MDNVIDVEKIEKQISKIKMYEQEEIEILDNLINQFGTICSYYSTTNDDLFKNIIFEFNNKFKILKQNHFNYEMVLEKNIKKYILVSENAISELKEHVDDFKGDDIFE